MTKTEALDVLKAPKFGDPACIEAVRVLEDEGEAEALRKTLAGKMARCWCCSGSGNLDCDAGCPHACPTCYGGRGKLLLTEKTLEKFHLFQLRDLAEELLVAT